MASRSCGSVRGTGANSRRGLRIAVGVALLVAFLAGSAPAYGLSFTSWLDVSANSEGSTCSKSIINIDFKLAKTADDGDGNDYGIMVVYDGTGTAIYSDHFTNGGKHLYSIAIGFWRPPSARPLTMRVFDPSIVISTPDSSQAQVDQAEASPEIASYKYDPGVDFAVCASLISTETLLATIPAAPGSLDHGAVLVGGTSDLDLTVRNDGVTPSDLDGNCPAASAPHSLVVGGDFGPLGVGETDTCTYRFSPTTRGSAPDAVTVTSDGGSAEIDLLGTGVAPLANVGDPSSSPYTRIGTSSAITILVSNDGDGNLSGLGAASNLLGAFPAKSGDFSGAGAAVSLADGASTNVVYSFAPSAHGASSDSVLASFSNGSTDGANGPVETPVSLDGVGVGPVFSTDLPPGGLLDFGGVGPGAGPVLPVAIENSSSDENGGEPDLTRLTVRGEITGPDASSFEIRSSPPVLGNGEAESFEIRTVGRGHGPVSALLTIYCDEGQPLGETTEVCAEVALEAEHLSAVEVPDLTPGGVLLLVLGFAILGPLWIRRIG